MLVCRLGYLQNSRRPAALLALVELGKKYKISGPTDLSTNHDDYLYGDKE